MSSVIERIRAYIEAGRWEEAGCTPPVRELRILCGASIEIVLKSLRYLTSTGELKRIPGKNRYFLSEVEQQMHESSTRGGRSPRWITVAAEIAGDLEKGLYAGRQVLPSAKTLGTIHGCSPGTIRRALHHLQEHGFIRRRTRNCWAVDYGRREPMGYCFVGNPNSFTLLQGNAHALVQELELELQRRNWGPLHFLLREQANYDRLASAGGWFHISTGDTSKWLSILSQTGIPGIVVDALESEKPLSPPEGLRAAVLKCDNRKAGLLVGKHLLQRGHREIVFFPPSGQAPRWSRRRLAGLQSVSSHTSNGWRVHEALSPSELVQGDTLHSFIKQMSGEIYRSIKKADVIPEIVARTMTRGLFQYLPEHRNSPAFERAFADALTRYPSGTAWVCANDYQALIALQFLRNRRIRVPGRISLASFDNTLYSYLCNLTSYDFGFAQMAHLGLEHLVRSRVGFPPLVRSVSGTVVPRMSTGGESHT